MAASPLNISLPETLKAYVEAQVESGAYGTPADFVRELILDDRDRHLARLEDRLLDNLKSEPIEVTEQEWRSEDLIEILRGKLNAVR